MLKPLLALLATMLLATPAFAGDDPSIKGPLRDNIQSAMRQHVAQTQIDGHYVIYDAVKGGLKRLTLKELHHGIVKKGDFYVSCADFVDARGTKYDVDFMVVRGKDDIHVYQALIHAIGKKKRTYHLEG